MVSPVTLKRFEDSVERAIQKMRSAVQENLLAFLPAKAGSGCTTIALNTAGYLAGLSGKGGPGKKVLLIEGDLHSGVISVLLDSRHIWSVLDALENAGELDYSLWMKYVTQIHGVDFLLADPAKKVFSSWTNYHHLLDFAASRYDHILVDLPEVVNDATIETVRRAKSVFVVCTPELPSVALAPQRCQELQNRGIPAEKVTILINRWHKGEITAGELAELVEHPVSAVFRNDYPTVARAAKDHEFVKPGSKLGQAFAEFARTLTGEPIAANGPLAFLRFG
jgi:pilus assembly protein CpaE